MDYTYIGLSLAWVSLYFHFVSILESVRDPSYQVSVIWLLCLVRRRQNWGVLFFQCTKNGLPEISNGAVNTYDHIYWSTLPCPPPYSSYISLKVSTRCQTTWVKSNIIQKAKTTREGCWLGPNQCFWWAAAIALWFCMHLPFCSSGFKSHAHHLCFFQFVILKLEWEKDEKTKSGHDWPIFKKNKCFWSTISSR